MAEVEAGREGEDGEVVKDGEGTYTFVGRHIFLSLLMRLLLELNSSKK